MEDLNNGEWVPRIRNGRIVYDHISICKPLPKFDIEDEIYQSFCNKFVFKEADEFKKLEENFLKTLTPKQKKMYFDILEKLNSYHVKRERKLILYAQDYGKIVFD